MKSGAILLCGLGAGAAITALLTTARGKRLLKRLTRRSVGSVRKTGKDEEFIQLIAQEFYDI